MYRNLLLSALGLLAFEANAQTVTVTLNDGTSQAWPAADVKEITFGEKAFYETEFSSVNIKPYSHGEVEIKLFGEGVTVCLDTFGPADAETLPTGEYVVGATTGLRINPDDVGYCYVNKDGVRGRLTGGSATVSNEGSVYTIAVDLTYEVQGNESSIVGKYVGTLNGIDNEGN